MKMLNGETITDGAKKAISREEVFARPLIEAAVKLLQSEDNMRKLNAGSIFIQYRKTILNIGFHITKMFDLQVSSQGKTVLDVLWDDAPDEKPIIRKFQFGDWEDAILNAARSLGRPH